jgi:hypothetical protein
MSSAEAVTKETLTTKLSTLVKSQLEQISDALLEPLTSDELSALLTKVKELDSNDTKTIQMITEKKAQKNAPPSNNKKKGNSPPVIVNVVAKRTAINVTAIGPVSAVKKDATKELAGFPDDLTVYVAAASKGGRRTRRRKAKRSKRTRRS